MIFGNWIDDWTSRLRTGFLRDLAARCLNPRGRCSGNAVGAPSAQRQFLFFAMMDQSALIDKKAVAKLLGVSLRTVTTLVARKQLPFIRVGPRLIRFRIWEVQRALMGDLGDSADREKHSCTNSFLH